MNDLFTFVSAHWSIISSLLMAIGLLAVMLLSKTFVRREECLQHRKEVAAQNTAVKEKNDQLEKGHIELTHTLKRLESMPTGRDMENLRLSLEKLTGATQTMQSKIDGQGQILDMVKSQGDRIHFYLLERKS